MNSGRAIVYAMLVLLLATTVSGFAAAQGKERIRADDVILIHNVYELQNMSKDLNASYALANDIDATITKTWNNGSGFVPIGNDSAPFNGTFDGNGHRIINLWINRSSQNSVGLFGYTSSNAVIENVGLVNVTVSGSADVGGLVGYNHGTVNDSYSTGSVSGSNSVGGLIGYNDGTVNNSYATSNVSGNSNVGGLFGWNHYGTVSNSHFSGNVSGSRYVGGFVGGNYGTVSNSYSTGNVSGSRYVGGLVGGNGGTVKNAHYDVDKVLINGGHHLTIGGIFDSQYNDWILHNLTLNISNYSSLVPDGDYYDINDVQGIKDLLGFCEGGYKFKLVADIDLSSQPNLYIPYFDGVFDGNNHTISNLSVQISFAGEIGLFGLNRGMIRNIAALNVNVSGSNNIGGLVGWNYYGTVNNSYATGNVSGSNGVGGLVGVNARSTVSNSYSTGNVSGSWDVGGLVGVNSRSTVSNSYSTGNVSGSWDVGGLVGVNSRSTVSNSYSTGNVSGSWDVGGLVGWNYYGTVSNSYSTGNVSGSRYVGGLVGGNGGTVKNAHYDVDKVLINGGHHLTIGGIFDSQYNDWISHNLTLNISNYSSLVPDGDYYDISDVQGIKDLLGFCEDGYKFKLVADIDLSSQHNLYIPYFDGVFDGNNHTISNLTVQISFANKIGLFGFNRGIIKNIGALNVNVSGDEYVGGLVGWNYYGTVNNSYATGNVSGNGDVGGLVGYNGGTVKNTYATGDVSASGDDARAGGLVGWNNGPVNNSYATGDVSASGDDARAGGLVGWNNGPVNNSYATGDVSASGWYSEAGGLVGENHGTVSNSYATGNVSGHWAGGLVGRNYGTVTASFWDMETSGIDHSAGGTGLTTEEMKNITTFLNAGWDFNYTWGIWDGVTYPFLRWQGLKSIASAPTNLHANVGDGYVNLTWNAPENDGGLAITEYWIYRNGVKIRTVPATQLWFNDTNVVDGQTYTYYVTAVNAAGESPKSNEVQATPGGNVPELTPIMITGALLLALAATMRRKK